MGHGAKLLSRLQQLVLERAGRQVVALKLVQVQILGRLGIKAEGTRDLPNVANHEASKRERSLRQDSRSSPVHHTVCREAPAARTESGWRRMILVEIKVLESGQFN